MPGRIRGKITLKKVLTGVLPRLVAALVILWSKPVNVAVTVITTKGVPKTMWARIIPGKVEAKPILAIKKNIADPEIIRGTTIGEIKTLMTSAL